MLAVHDLHENAVLMRSWLCLFAGHDMHRSAVLTSGLATYVMSKLHYQTMCDTLPFALASMIAATCFCVSSRLRSITSTKCGADLWARDLHRAYHYTRVFNSWVESYFYSACGIRNGARDFTAPQLAGVPLNDAYQYRD